MDNNMAPEKTTDQTPQQPQNETMYCSNCGEKIAKTAKFCSHCGAPTAQILAQQSQTVPQPQPAFQPQPVQQPQIIINNTNSNVNTNQNIQKQYYGGWKKPKSKWVALFLCVFFGYIGFHIYRIS